MRKQPAGKSSLSVFTATKTTPACSFTLNKEGIVTGATTWMLKILGYMQEEFVGHHLSEFLVDGGEGRLRTTRLVDSSVARHRAVLVGKDYISRPVLLHASREYVFGWLPRATCLVEIINALNRADVKYQALGSQFQAVLGSMEGGAYGIDLDGRCLFINETAASFLGVHAQKVLGKPIHDLIICDSHDAAWLSRERDSACDGFRPGNGCPIEGVTVWKHDGMSSLVEYSSAPILQSGEITGTVVTFADVSTRGRTIQTLRENVETFRHLAQFSREVFWILNPKNDRMLYVSPEYEATWGRTAEELYRIPGSWFAHMHPDDRASLKNILESSSEGYEIEYRIVRPDGLIRWVHDRAYAMSNASGDLYRMAGIAEDITAYKVAAEALQNSLARSQALSCYTERAREEERMRIGQELHDNLGNILTYLKLDLTRLDNQLLKKDDGNISAYLKHKLEAMVEATDMAISTVQRVGMELRPILLEQFGLIAALDWQAKEFERHTGIHCLLEENFVTNPINRNHAVLLFRIVQEALTNVARHAQATDVTITVNEDGENVLLIVEDNGKGIPEAVLSETTSFGLMGMKERARLAGGVLLFDSSSGKGTRVTVRVPVSELKKDSCLSLTFPVDASPRGNKS